MSQPHLLPGLFSGRYYTLYDTALYMILRFTKYCALSDTVLYQTQNNSGITLEQG